MSEKDTGPTEGREGPRAGHQGAVGKPDAAPPASPADAPAREPTPVTQQIGRVVLLLLLVLFGIFAATNAQPVDFSWVFGGTEATEGPAGETEGGVPLIVLLVLSFAIGAVVGAGVTWQSSRARRRAREVERDR